MRRKNDRKTTREKGEWQIDNGRDGEKQRMRRRERQIDSECGARKTERQRIRRRERQIYSECGGRKTDRQRIRRTDRQRMRREKDRQIAPDEKRERQKDSI